MRRAASRVPKPILVTLAHCRFQAPPLPFVEGRAIVFFGFNLLLPTAPNPAKLDSYPNMEPQHSFALPDVLEVTIAIQFQAASASGRDCLNQATIRPIQLHVRRSFPGL